jgi:hypothetical protein
MAFDNTKYHVQLGDVPYSISGYNKGELNTFIPRLSSGDETESEFDLLKSKTLNGFSGGSLQRYWDDDTSAFAIQQMYPIYEDGTLYPVGEITSAVDLLQSAEYYITAYLVTPTYTWIAVRDYLNTTNEVFRITTGHTVQAITLPSQLSGTSGGTTDAGRISSIVQHGTQIWFAGYSGVALGYLDDTSDTSVTAVGSGTTPTLSKMVSFRGSLYGTDGKQGDEWGAKLFRHTGGTSSRARVEVGYIGRRNDSQYHEVLVYNNRIMLLRNDGMYAYDGVQLVTVEDATDHINDQNYRFARVLKGYLYYFMPDGMYRFNGSLVEKLYDISEIGYPVSSCTGINRLWIAFSNSANLGSSRYDKAVGKDHSTGTSIDARVMCFNGEGMYEYARTPVWTQQASPAFTGRGEVDTIFWFNNKIYMFSKADTVGVSASGNNRYYTFPTNERSQTGNKAWTIITSIFDGGFSVVKKHVDNVELLLDGYVPSDQTITVGYRTGGFDGSTAFTTAGTISTQTELKRLIWKTISAGVLTGKQIQFSLSGTTDVRTGIKRFTQRYLLSPEMKWQWQFNVNCYGDNDLEPLQLSDDSDGTQAVNLLRDNLYTLANARTPFIYIDIDQLDLNEVLDDSETTVTLNSTKLLKGDDGFIKIDDEIIYWSAKTATDLTVTRGALGTTPASHVDNSKVFVVYRVQMSIQSEPVELNNHEVDATEDKTRATEISVVLKEV